jgi:hypothetical protein
VRGICGKGPSTEGNECGYGKKNAIKKCDLDCDIVTSVSHR